MSYLIKFCIIASIIIFTYATFIERNLLNVKKLSYELNEENKNNSTIKIVQIADTQLGMYFGYSKLEKVVSKINSLNPHIIFFNGDLVDRTFKKADKDKIISILNKLNNNAIKICVYGNHDKETYTVDRYKYIMTNSNFTILENSNISLKIRGLNLFIAGVDDALQSNINKTTTTKGISNNTCNILLMHEPDVIDYFEEYNFHISLAGHSHGGQIALPLIGPLFKNTMCKNYNRGLYNLSEDKIFYVNTGLGNTALPFRMGNIPVILDLDIKY